MDELVSIATLWQQSNSQHHDKKWQLTGMTHFSMSGTVMASALWCGWPCHPFGLFGRDVLGHLLLSPHCVPGDRLPNLPVIPRGGRQCAPVEKYYLTLAITVICKDSFIANHHSTPAGCADSFTNWLMTRHEVAYLWSRLMSCHHLNLFIY